MPTIRIEYEVPEDDCRECTKNGNGPYYYSRTKFCIVFNMPLKYNDQYSKVNRCQACIDAEVKEGE